MESIENRSERKRESFVDPRRKSLTLSSIFIAENEEPPTKQPKHSMKSYLESLVREKDDWKEIFKRTKKLCEDSEKHQGEPFQLHRETAEKLISPEDREYLDNRPNYMEMVNSVQEYVNIVGYLNKYKLDIIDYYKKACYKISINNKQLIDEMSSDDLCDICNVKNCEKLNHKFDI